MSGKVRGIRSLIPKRRFLDVCVCGWVSDRSIFVFFMVRVFVVFFFWVFKIFFLGVGCFEFFSVLLIRFLI